MEDYCRSRGFQIQPIGKLLNIEDSGDQLVPYFVYVDYNSRFQISKTIKGINNKYS